MKTGLKVTGEHSVHTKFDFSVPLISFRGRNLWLGSLAVACRAGDREVAGSTPGRSTAS